MDQLSRRLDSKNRDRTQILDITGLEIGGFGDEATFYMVLFGVFLVLFGLRLRMTTTLQDAYSWLDSRPSTPQKLPGVSFINEPVSVILI